MFFDIGGWMRDIFGPDEMGILLLILLIFLLDAVFFPTLPELFFVMGFMAHPTLMFGGELLLAALVGEIIGITSLYYAVEKIGVPAKIKKVADRYINFLVVSDERILLVNRIAPCVPFVGAFISIIESWRMSRAMAYVVSGCIIKYGAIMLMSSFFYEYFSSEAAGLYTVLFVIAVIIISIVFAFVRKKRAGINENC